MAAFKELTFQLRDWFLSQPLSRRMSISGALVASLIGIGGFVWYMNYTPMEMIYDGQNPDDAGAVVEYLKANNIRYEVRENSTIFIPQSAKGETQVALAAQNIITGGSEGYGVFKEAQFSTTSEQTQILLLRALQGELQRTINSLKVIRSNRVLITMPKRSIFRNDTEPTASVVLTLYPGRDLSADQIRGIKHIVANAVPRMKPESVSVTNDQGELLSEDALEKAMDPLEQKRLFQSTFEEDIREKISNQLAHLYGKGHFYVTVTADFDSTVKTEILESYSPDENAVRTEETLINMEPGAPQPGGVPGSPSNRPLEEIALGENTNTAGLNSHMSKKEYEVSKTETKIIHPTQMLKSIQVSVSIDENFDKSLTLADDENTGPPATNKTLAQVRQAREADIQELTQIIKPIMGFSEDREGDFLNVSFAPFNEEAIRLAQAVYEEPQWYDMLQLYMKEILLGVMLLASVLLFVLMVGRPFVRYLEGPSESLLGESDIQTVAELEASLDPNVRAQLDMHTSQIEKTAEMLKQRERERINQEVLDMAKGSPEKSAKQIKAWLDATN